MDFKVNANQNVKVKLTEFGVQILVDKYNKLKELLNEINVKEEKPFTLRVDEEGYYTTQLWILMSDFGHVMDMTHDIPFELDIIMTNGEPI